jgi:hypothetical protein
MSEPEIDVDPKWHRRGRKAWRQAALLLGDILRAIAAADGDEIPWLTSGGRRIAAIVPPDDAEYLASHGHRCTSLSGRLSGTEARVSMRGMPEGLEPGIYRVRYEDAETEDGVLTLRFRYAGRGPEPHAGPAS